LRESAVVAPVAAAWYGGGVDLDRLARIMLVHQSLLERWRVAMDLVGPGPIEPHLRDSVEAITGLEVGGVWADLGSGAGFPGIALAAAFPNAKILLVERRQKRAVFLRRVVVEAGLSNAEVVEGDAEGLASGSLDGITSRAYKPPVEYLIDCRRLLAAGGIAVVLTAGGVPELPAGFSLAQVRNYRIDDKPRASVRFQREAAIRENGPASG
jgi:16S rRNA (guanine527-N7)-methyltransferase